MPDTHDESGPFRDDLRTQLVTAGTEAAERWLTVRANRKMSDVNRKRLAGHVVNVLWDGIERAAVEMAEYIAAEQLAAASARAESATVLHERWRALIAERDAANERAEKAKAALAEANGRADKFCGAFSDAGSLAYRRGKLLDEAITRQAELAKERDEARELACASLDILRNVSDEPMRELFEVDDMDEMPAWFTGYGKPPAAVAPDALQEALSEPVERSEASGGHGEGSNSRATAAGLSEPHAFVVCATCNGSGGYCQRCREGQAGLPHCAHIVTCPDCLGGGTYPPATEDGQHG